MHNRCLTTGSFTALAGVIRVRICDGKYTLFFFIYLFVVCLFRLHWVFIAARGVFLVAASGGYSSLRCAGFLLLWLLLLQSMGSRHAGFSSCNTRAQ